MGVVAPVNLWYASKTYMEILGPPQKVNKNHGCTLKIHMKISRLPPKVKTKLPIRVCTPQMKILDLPLPCVEPKTGWGAHFSLPQHHLALKHLIWTVGVVDPTKVANLFLNVLHFLF